MSPLLEKRLLIGYDQLTVTNLLSKKNLHYGKQWVCRVPKHTAKTQKHSAKDLPCVTHGKQRTAKLGRHTGCLPCALFRAHGKSIAVCFIGPTAK